MKLPALALVAALTAHASPSAQAKFARHRQPLRVVSLNLETGEVVRAPSVSPQAVVTATDLDNLDLGGFIGVDTGGGFCEWIDSAYKGAGGGGTTPIASDLVSNFVFAYCSSALDTNSGGPGGTMTWSFFPSHTTQAPHPATSNQVGAFTLTGLPAHTANGALFTRVTCMFLEVDFGSVPLAFPDGQIGYSWTFEDLDSTGIYAATFPFLSCVQSCSGNGPDGWGMDDMIDQYCPANIPGSTPFPPFTPTMPPIVDFISSINIDMRELNVASTVGTFQGTAPGSIQNPDFLTTTPAVIGRDFEAVVIPQPDRAGTPGFDVFVVIVNSAGACGVTIIIDLAPILIGHGSAPLSQALACGSVLGVASGTLNGPGVPSNPATLAIPVNTAYLGLGWTAQAIVFGDITTDGVMDLDPMFSSGAFGEVGSY